MKADTEAMQLSPIHTIFIADDDADDQLLFRQALQDVAPHIRLEASKDGNELLSLLQNFKPDLLFLDLDMPSKNGLECLKAIRSNPVFSDMYIIVFSSTTRPANIEVAYEMGADLFFAKPSFYQELVQTLKTLVELNWNDPKAVNGLKSKNSSFMAKNNTAEEGIKS